MNQKERALKLVDEVCIKQGAELLFCHVGEGSECKNMIDEFDKVLSRAGTFVDVFNIVGSSQSVFTEKIQSAVQGVVAHAVAPATAEGIELFSGTDVGVMVDIACSRFKDEILKELKGKETKLIEKNINTLLSKDYDLVRVNLSNLNTGKYKYPKFR